MGELINIAGLIADTQIAQSIARDTEVNDAIAASSSLLSRSGSGVAVDANLVVPASLKKPLAIIWIDANGSYSNFPAGFAGNGVLIQIDGLSYTTQQGNSYRVQFLSQLSGSSSILYYRTQNTAWNPWVKLA